MSIPKTTEKKFHRLLKQLVKRRFCWRSYATTPERWWDLYNMAVLSGLISDSRFTGIEGVKVQSPSGSRHKSCRQVIHQMMFDNESFYYMSQGKRQSLTYRSNRMHEHLKDFAYHEKDSMANERYSAWHKGTRLAHDMNISSIWKVKIDGCDVGIVFSPTLAGATQKAKMFVVPMVAGLINEDPSSATVDIRHIYHSTPESAMEDYISVSTAVTDQIKKNNTNLELRIERLQAQIKGNNAIISSVRNNMMVELEVNQ